MPTLQFFKETAMPGQLVGNAVYMIAPTARPDYVEIYVTNAAGTASRRSINQVDIQAMIDAAVAGSAGGSGTVIVDNIAGRDAIPTGDRPNALTVLVIDASADATVDAGAATYVWRQSNSTWIKVSEAESLDLSLTWAMIGDGPTSTPAAIDAAVAASHSHLNKTQLDKIGEDGAGLLTYDGELPKTGWNSTNW